MPTEILQHPKKKNIIFEEIVVFYFISIFISVFIVTPAPISAAKMTMKTIKSVR